MCTSGNDIQSKEFRLIEGAPAGIGSDEMVRPVGLAPIRFLSGRTAGTGATVSATRAGRNVLSEAIAPDTAFRIAIPDEADTIVVDGAGLGRRLALSPYPAYLGVLSAGRTPIGGDDALETIDFNGVTPRGLRKIPSGYAGLNWFNLNAISRDFAGGNDGYVNGNTSGDHMAYTSSGNPAELWSDKPFGFHSVMISSAWLNAEGETREDRELARGRTCGRRRDSRIGADADPLCADVERHHSDTLLVEALLAAGDRRSCAGAVNNARAWPTAPQKPIDQLAFMMWARLRRRSLL